MLEWQYLSGITFFMLVEAPKWFDCQGQLTPSQGGYRDIVVEEVDEDEGNHQDSGRLISGFQIDRSAYCPSDIGP